MAKRGQGEGSISRRPDGTWWARISLGKDENGKQKRKAFYGKTRKEVQEKMNAALDDYNRGNYINPSRMSVGQWMDIWLNDYKKMSLKASTFHRYHQSIRLQIKPLLGSISLADLRPETVQKAINDLAKQGLAFGTILHILMVLNGALTQAVKNGLIAKNPGQDAVLPKRQYGTKDVLTPEEQAIFIEAVTESPYGAVYITILATGLRIGEATALTWDDIDFKEGTLRVNKTQYYTKDDSDPEAKYTFVINDPKTKTSVRTVPLLASITEMLKQIQKRQQELGPVLEDNNLVFRTVTGRRIKPHALRTDLRKRVKAMGLGKTITPHGLRHTFATRGLENGIPLRVMQELLGHANIKMTADLYTHVLPETKKDAVMLLEGTIDLDDGAGHEDEAAADDAEKLGA